jgi:hypothetical protein
VSKFRHTPFDLSDDERCRIFVEYVSREGRSRGNNVAAFYRATFDAWKDYNRTGREEVYVGYSPIIAVDADKILQDLPAAHVLHVVRNPWSAYADTKKRPVPLSLEGYLTAWVETQYHALVFQKIHPDRIHIVRYEDVIEAPRETLGRICAKLGLEASDSLEMPTWNRNPLEEVYPWGTIRRASPAANKITAEELSGEEIAKIRVWADHYLEVFNYTTFM